MPKVTIIIPCYNTEQYIGKCLDSILTQEFSDYEIIIVDDGSSDSSGIICDEYSQKDNRIRVFHQKNNGVCTARNLGLLNAKGEWVTFIDSDDTISSNYFELRGMDDCDLLVQRWRFSFHDDSIEPLKEGIYIDDDYLKFMQYNAHKDIMRMAVAKFLKREIIEKYKLRFDPKIRLGEDTVFMQEYFSHVKSVAVSNTSYYIYYRPDNWGGSKYQLTRGEFRYFFYQFYKMYKSLPYLNVELFIFLYSFMTSFLVNKDSLYNKLFLLTLPEYVSFKKKMIDKKNIVSILKWTCAKSCSYFNFLLI